MLATLKAWLGRFDAQFHLGGAHRTVVFARARATARCSLSKNIASNCREQCTYLFARKCPGYAENHSGKDDHDKCGELEYELRATAEQR